VHHPANLLKELICLEIGKRRKPLDPCTVTHNFARIAERAGLGNVRFHDLRHTFASIMLLRGAKPKVISEALGHSSVGFTLDTYSHTNRGDARRCDGPAGRGDTVWGTPSVPRRGGACLTEKG